MADHSEEPLDPEQLAAYFAVMEVAGLLRHGVEEQLRDEGDLSFVQFQLLAVLGLDSPAGSRSMTELADRIVFSRSGLTYQAGLLEKAGLVSRAPAAHDERGVTVSITAEGRERLERVLPGHVDVVRSLFLSALPAQGSAALTELLAPVRDHMRSQPPRSRTPRRRRGSSRP
ncbi:MarR family winged helix-turn-helix transcriptional regulator [Nocardioides sp. CFH 31398]|uniref:MarR family winged helix-turn-helix transcriptional regulator n=1 Tax=Nocardioides sp. CFH 31398 TaxID=2919579 RepID=UPI001F058F3E|nr:MarR family transcriptional regulator [Nocardioides sp. CFH 31398]MCH1865753.1 MarR family transcriptional regulator [Nocardioides sp. CFH 31398]